MVDMSIIEKARAKAERHKGDEPAVYYLCKNERTSTVYQQGGAQTPEAFMWDIYTAEQHGYKTATERIPLHPEKRTIVQEVEWWREKS